MTERARGERSLLLSAEGLGLMRGGNQNMNSYVH